MAEKRSRVPEWRVTLFYGPWTIRFWFEADVSEGGVSLFSTAEHSAKLALERYVVPVLRVYNSTAQAQLAEHLIANVLGLSSVEICTPSGNGVCLHKNWP